MEITDELLLRFAPRARELWLERATEGPDRAHVFSRRFLRKMNVLLRRQRRTPAVNRALRVARRVAVVLLALILCAGTVLAFDAEAREAVVKWFKETFDHAVVYQFTDEEPETKTIAYSLGWLPQGFELFDSDYDETFGDGYCYYMERDGEHSIILNYSVMADNMLLELLNIDDPSQIESVEINGLYGEYCPANDPLLDYSELVLFDEEQNMVIRVSSNLSKEDILHIASEIKMEEFIK